MIKEYLEVWNLSFDLKESLSRKNYWVFVCVNYLCFAFLILMLDFLHIEALCLIFQLLFVLVLISAGIRRMNDIKKPWFYLFIPFYNFVLLLEKGVDETNAVSFESHINGFDFLKLLLLSIVIGLVNLLLACVLPDHNTSFYHDYVLLTYCACLIPLSLIIFPLLTIIFKKKVTKASLFTYFLLFLFFSSIITFLFLQS